jgi:hypothetical protein
VLTSTGKPKFEKNFIKDSESWNLDELMECGDKDGFCVLMESGTYAYPPYRFFILLNLALSPGFQKAFIPIFLLSKSRSFLLRCFSGGSGDREEIEKLSKRLVSAKPSPDNNQLHILKPSLIIEQRTPMPVHAPVTEPRG